MKNSTPGADRLALLTILASLFLAAPAVARADPITEAEAITEITRVRGRIERNEKLPDRPVVSVKMNRDTIGDEQLIWLKPLTSLTTLQLGFTKITDSGLRELEGLENLESLC